MRNVPCSAPVTRLVLLAKPAWLFPAPLALPWLAVLKVSRHPPRFASKASCPALLASESLHPLPRRAGGFIPWLLLSEQPAAPRSTHRALHKPHTPGCTGKGFTLQTPEQILMLEQGHMPHPSTSSLTSATAVWPCISCCTGAARGPSALLPVSAVRACWGVPGAEQGHNIY